MSGLEVRQVDEVAIPTHRALHRNQVRERADWGLNAIHATGIRTSQKCFKPH